MKKSAMPIWIGYPLSGCAVIAIYFVVSHGLSMNTQIGKVTLYAAISLSAAVALAAGLLRYRPPDKAPWILLLLSQLVYFSADTTFYIRHDLLGIDAFPSVADLLYGLHYPFLLAALFLLVRRRTPGRDIAGLLDATIITLGAALLSWVFVLEPSLHAAGATTSVAVGALYQPLFDIAVLALALRLTIGSGERTPCFYLFVAGMAINLVTNCLFGLQQVMGTYASGNFLDAGWLFAYLMLGACALHPSMRRLSQPSAIADQTASLTRLGLLAAASLTAPITLVTQSLIRTHIDVWVNALASAAMFLLVIARLAGLVAAARHSAITDGLTGLHNRRFFEEQLRLEVQRAARSGSSLALLIFDVDGFKSVNDVYGHPAGDRVLRHIADRLRNASRSGDIVARYGGEEFAVLAPGIPAGDLERTITRLQAAIADEPMPVNDNVWLAITASIGAAAMPLDAIDADTLVSTADRAMYETKHARKDRNHHAVLNHPTAAPPPAASL